MKKKWIIISILGIVILTALVVAKKQGWIGKGKDEQSVKVETVETQTIVETVTASGKIQPEMEVKISSEVSGEIIALPIKEGQEVEEGDLLVKINPDLYESAVTRAIAAVNTAKAGLASAQAQYIEAEKSFNRNKKLYNEEVISQSEYDASVRAYSVAKLNVESARYQLNSAKANLDEARKNLKRTTIQSPTKGTISMLNVEHGERVVGTAQMTGTEMLRVANLNQMEVLVEVNENDIVRVNLGDTAIIEVDAYLNREFQGVVTEIANSANLVNASADQVTNFEVKVRILPSSYKDLTASGKIAFRPGMTATVDIKTEHMENVIAVPIQAVTIRTDTSSSAKTYKMKRKKSSDDDQTKAEEEDHEYEVVFLKNGNKAKLVVVETGIQDDRMIQIKSGLEGGEEIIVGPYNVVSKKLKNGTPINLDKDSGKEDKDAE